MQINEGGTAEDTMPFVPCFTARDEKAFFIPRKKFLMEFLKEVFQMAEKTMEKIVALAKNRGFVYPGSEIYGGLANTWDYGPIGVELKNNVKKAWWKKFIQESPYFPE